MKNELQIFNNNYFGSIRTVEIDGKPYFVANDIAKALGYKNISDAIERHCRWVVKHDIPHPQSKTKTLEVNIIPEGDMYRLVTNSELPTAEKFESWIFDEVLPTLRKTGTYEMPKKEKKEDKTDRTQIMLMNARSRVANTYLKLANVDTLSPTYKSILVAKATEALSGEELIPLPKIEQKTYSAGEIGEKLGISSNMVGRLANKHNLKIEKYGCYVRDKKKHCEGECDTWRYYDTVIPVLKNILNMEVA